ncbi:MAG TPA: transposase [Thermomicrobiales bacterium]|nr:transposase [Thermomicrobiales bacterium]
MARTLPALRAVPAGDDRLLPGKLITAFNVRTQQFQTVLTTDLPRQKVAAREVVATLPVRSLILADLDYFSFRWFDELTDADYWYVSKLRNKTSWAVVHVLSAHGQVRDELVWLGAYRADQAKHLVRRIQVPVGKTVHTYLTNVLDPRQLAIVDVIRLYARRWDIEFAFKTVKRDLGLHLHWSAKWELILTQIWGALLIAQIAAALRAQIAQRAGIDLFDVSLTLLLRDLPHLVRRGDDDLIGRIAALPVTKGGYLRPSRRMRHTMPDDLPMTPPPQDLRRVRTPRYVGRRCGPSGTDLRPA